MFQIYILNINSKHETSLKVGCHQIYHNRDESEFLFLRIILGLNLEQFNHSIRDNTGHNKFQMKKSEVKYERLS